MPSLVFLQNAGETERAGFGARFAGVVELVSVGAIDGAGDGDTPALRRHESFLSVKKEPGFLVLGWEESRLGPVRWWRSALELRREELSRRRELELS